MPDHCMRQLQQLALRRFKFSLPGDETHGMSKVSNLIGHQLAAPSLLSGPVMAELYVTTRCQDEASVTAAGFLLWQHDA